MKLLEIAEKTYRVRFMVDHGTAMRAIGPHTFHVKTQDVEVKLPLDSLAKVEQVLASTREPVDLHALHPDLDKMPRKRTPYPLQPLADALADFLKIKRENVARTLFSWAIKQGSALKVFGIVYSTVELPGPVMSRAATIEIYEPE